MIKQNKGYGEIADELSAAGRKLEKIGREKHNDIAPGLLHVYSIMDSVSLLMRQIDDMSREFNDVFSDFDGSKGESYYMSLLDALDDDTMEMWRDFIGAQEFHTKELKKSMREIRRNLDIA